MKKQIIWSNNLYFEDWRDDLEREYPDSSEEELIEIMYDINSEYLDDERVNLNIQLNQPIIVIGDLGLWNGRVSGYKLIKSGNIKDCLYSDAIQVEWFIDGYNNFKATEHHHDGINYLLYRIFKDDISEVQKENFLDKIYKGECTNKDITKYTESIGKIILER